MSQYEQDRAIEPTPGVAAPPDAGGHLGSHGNPGASIQAKDNADEDSADARPPALHAQDRPRQLGSTEGARFHPMVWTLFALTLFLIAIAVAAFYWP